MRGFRVWGFLLRKRGDHKRAKEPSGQAEFPAERLEGELPATPTNRVRGVRQTCRRY